MGQGLLTPVRFRPLLATIVVAILAAMAAPRRYLVDGLSMAPGLMPGDLVATGWFPLLDRLERPARLETWVVEAPGPERAVKRVMGLPGENIRVVSGDLVVDGTPLLKPPPTLAEVAVAVPLPALAGDTDLELEPWEVLDDVAFAREVNRPLEPVADVGLTALVCAGDTAGRVVVDVDAARIGWRLEAHERVRIVAGRLDRHLVGVAWRVRQTPPADERQPLPSDMPAAWSVACPRSGEGDACRRAPCLRLRSEPAMRIEAIAVWRDAHFRPAADGTASWNLGGDEYLLLGDFPTGSVDSRQWGPLARGAILQRVSPRR